MSKKLLLADDSITIQKVIGITFANEDVALAIADNGDSALALARADRPDLILADVLMPGLDGYELCAAVKNEPALRGVPVLLLTGTFEPFDEDKARGAGADGWIAKPFESQALIDRVNSLLALAPERLARPAATAAVAPAATAAPRADMWRESSVAPALPGEISTPVAEDLVEEDEGFWGDFTLEEEDMTGEPAAPPASEAPPATPPAAEAESVEEDEEVLELDDADILFDEEDETLADPEEIVPAESLPVEEPPVAAVTPAPPVFEFSAPLAPPARAEEAAPSPSVSVGGEASLSEDAMAAVVERVAAEVVNRLAGTILERIAWEVVPDLAESLIKDEIRKIKEALK
ncbi:response regulator [Geoalkalibacter sp.]|uniref:response regulator n=1 Tax=Geoalkalibacter sp. TaxID=3041440 RepID=UPI00272EC861|nr:response regulator [Geoalkalibacter sp.]